MTSAIGVLFTANSIMAEAKSDHLSAAPPEQTRGWRRLKSIIAVVVVNLMIFGVLLELGSVVTYYFRKGELFYLRTPAGWLEGIDLQLPAQANTTIGFHPYFGFAHLSTHAPANNHGFASRPMVSYPYHPSKDEFVIGVFGGSVAAMLGFEDGEELAEILMGRPQFAGRKVRVLNFAVSGFKQPQQWSVLAYYLAAGQRFDAVVNLDGLNEVVSGSRNVQQGRDVTMPANDILGSYVNFIDNAAPNAVLPPYYSFQRNRYLRLNQECRFASCALATAIAARWYQEWYLEAIEATAGTSKPNHFVIYGAPAKAGAEADPFPDVADLWARASLAMAKAAATNGALYLHVLQPNQYHATERKMGARERAIAINENSYVKPAVVAGYPLLLARIRELRGQGVNVVDGTRMFDDLDSSVLAYEDDCCHFGEEGRNVMVKFVADQLERIVVDQKQNASAR